MGFDTDSRSALFAHCVAGTVNAVHENWNRHNGRLNHADTLAGVLDLDMAAAPVMAAGEGVETMLSLRQALPLLPAVAALSAAHLAAWVFPALLRRLYVVCDADPAGEWAFARLSSRGHASALTVLPLRPRLDDLNSDLMACGLTALREWIVPQLAEGDTATFLPCR